MPETETKIDLGHSSVAVVVLDRISAEHVVENMVDAAVSSLIIGQDQMPGIQEDVKRFLLSEDDVLL